MNVRLTYLYQRYIDDACSKEEREELLSIIAENPENDTIVSLLDNTWDKIGNDKLTFPGADSVLLNILSNHQKPTTKKIPWYRYVAAASIVICIGIGFYFYQKNSPIPTEITAKNDIAPGGNKAFLTLADGKRIVLTDAKTGELAEQSGVKITKASDGQLIYTVSNLSKENNKINAYNTIETPRGGTYQVRLPDGTKVWLNAASTIKYPVSFSSRQARRVLLLSGEAYFEVAKDKQHPFIVQTDQQQVKVLGTHFNINNYSDESSVKTTLLEGSIQISSRFKDGIKSTVKTLKPNEQATFDGKNLKVTNTDTEEVIAWKNGFFLFKDERIENIMRKLGRWYDVEVEFRGKRPDTEFSGKISQKRNISAVLEMLEFTGSVHFILKGRKVIVMD